ncbi:hypothetical protein N7532_001622 [Penicillium argentinense]|uniref:Pre-mRNA-splicing factor 38B n=1 Tax=Penicillium argentinense TaxID=1131581 RepID=A0A9W9G2Y4_9EURO|nr:uncharacterized protein N7532_001622 [Penicillium argentinense]KAJ5111087.1 hypothetical protein N7532_001622 [Penicillium argentinense]
MDDDSIAELLAKEARESSQRYSREGLLAYQTRRPAGKPNMRFLRNLLMDTDSHNTALKRKEEREARGRMRELSEKKRDEIHPRTSGKGDQDRRSSVRDSERRRRGDDKYDLRDEDRDREHSRRSHRRSHRHRSRSTSTSSERNRSRRHRREETREKFKVRETSSNRDKYRDHDDYRDRKEYRDRDRQKKRERSKDRDGEGRERRRDRHGHRSSRSDRRHRERSNSSSRSRSPRRSKHTSRSRSHEPDREHKSRHEDEHCSPIQKQTERKEDDKLRRDIENESDSLDELIGPTLPGDSKAPIRSRGRGAYKSNTSAIDSHFVADYDPALDLHLEDDEQPTQKKPRHVVGLSQEDDWDMALEALRDRARWRQKGEERLRAAGMNESTIERWKSNASSSAVNGDEKPEQVQWSKKGEGREWDRGKVMDDRGHTDVHAQW